MPKRRRSRQQCPPSGPACDLLAGLPCELMSRICVASGGFTSRAILACTSKRLMQTMQSRRALGEAAEAFQRDATVCRLWWLGHRKEALVALIRELSRINPHAEEAQLRGGLSFQCDDGHDGGWGLSLEWQCCQLESLPESIAVIEVTGSVNLGNNHLTSLPESFGNLAVGGQLWLYRNQLDTLPESFGNLAVGGLLDLSNNQLHTLPESFGNVKVRGDLNLSYNHLNTLPESFGNLAVGGGLDLSNNQLHTLPESFGNVRMGGGVNLSYNQLDNLPVSFGNVTMGGSLYLSSDQFPHLHLDHLGSVTMGGSLYL